MIIGQLTKIAIQLTGVVALARLLSPEDFGLVAMVTVFMALGDLIRDFGMPTAALQARHLSHQQASNAFWANTALGAGAAALLVITSPALVQLYDEPRLTELAPVMAVALLLNGAQAQVQVQLARAGRFGALATTDVLAQLLGLAAGIVAATAGGLAYWSLVVQLLTATASLFVLRFITVRWLPSRPRRGHGSRALMRAGGQIGVAQLLTYAANNVDSMVIGARWGAVSLGFYNRAFQLFALPRAGILEPLTQVVLPTVNRAADEEREPFDLLLRAQMALGIGMSWIYMTGATLAPWAIPTVLGSEWERSAELFSILAVAGCFTTFGSICYWAFLVSHQNRQLLYLHLVTKPVIIISILVAAPHGLEAVAWAYSISMAVNWPINLAWLRWCARLDAWSFLSTGSGILLSAAGGYGAGALVGGALAPDTLSGSITAALVGTAVFVALLAVGRTSRETLATIGRSVVSRARM